MFGIPSQNLGFPAIRHCHDDQIGQISSTVFMPAVLPQMPQARAYIEPNERLFDDDGVVFTSTNAEQPVLLGNWYAQQRWTGNYGKGKK